MPAMPNIVVILADEPSAVGNDLLTGAGHDNAAAGQMI